MSRPDWQASNYAPQLPFRAISATSTAIAGTRIAEARRRAALDQPETANLIANKKASTITAGESWEKRPAKTFASA